jgi:sugar lactone lactonase YvrE
VLAQGFGSPDDLAVAPNGDILFGDFGNGALNVLHPGATQPVPLSNGFNEPEGIVVAKDGAYIVAEQGTNRIIEVDPATGSKKTLRQLVNRTGKDGVDGLGLDPATGDILIPDAPNGRLMRMSRDGTKLTTIATGYVRPTDMEIEPGGNIIVADELGNTVYRLHPNGTRVKLATIYQPDDIVIAPDGSIYANSLDGKITRIDPDNGQTRVIISGLKLPHGLDFDPQGNLIVAEAGRNRIIRLKT